MYQQALDKVSKQVLIRDRYDNFIGGKWVAPVEGKYFDNPSPITGKRLCQVPRSTAADIELALDAAHKAKDAWGRTSVQERARILNKVADKIESNLDLLALVETLDNGKPIRETTHADMPLVVDHWRYFASVVRAQEGGISEIDQDTVAYHFHEPLGVVGQIIPWNFPILMATWKLAPALAAGNCVVLKPAEQTPLGILVVMELIADILPPGVVNVVNGFGIEAGKPLAQNKRIAKIAFTGETTTGRMIMQYASDNIIPVTLELGGKSPNIFFADVAAEDDDFLDKALEGFAMFALNQGEVCTCPSRVLVQETIYDKFMEKAVARTKKIKQGHPRPGDHDRRPGLERPAREDPVVPRHRQAGRRQGADRRQACQAGWRIGGGLLRRAHHLRRQQQDAHLPGGDFRTGRSRSRNSRTRTMRFRSPTTRCMASAPASGPATATAPTGSAGRSRLVGSGPIATTPIPRTRPLAGTSNQASGVRTTR
jgi:acyl-CoA reductase-like NAD-dependent aldehyde dehydrogenase